MNGISTFFIWYVSGEKELPDASEKKSRTSLTDMQTKILTAAFRSCAKPSRQMREQLSAQTSLDQRVIQVWFQNKRAKCKRDNSDENNNASAEKEDGVSHVTPPGGFPLPIVNGGERENLNFLNGSLLKPLHHRNTVESLVYQLHLPLKISVLQP